MLNTRLYTKTQNTRAAKPRAAILLEFVLTLPFTLIFLMFVVDMGRMYLAAGAVHDAAWRAARAAAVAGVRIRRDHVAQGALLSAEVGRSDDVLAAS